MAYGVKRNRRWQHGIYAGISGYYTTLHSGDPRTQRFIPYSAVVWC